MHKVVCSILVGQTTSNCNKGDFNNATMHHITKLRLALHQEKLVAAWFQTCEYFQENEAVNRKLHSINYSALHMLS